MSATISVEGDDFSILYREVQKVDKELAKNLRRRLTQIAQPVRDDVRRAALAIPSGGSASLPIGAGTEKGLAKAMRKPRGGSTGLRQGIAGATEIKVMPSRPGHFAIRIRVSGSKFAAKTGKPVTLPRYMEGLARKPWRHPVFGNREVWAPQSSHPFLLPTAMRHKAIVHRQVKNAVQETVDTVLARKLRG